MASVKKVIVKIPLFGYLVRMGVTIIQLPRYMARFQDTFHRVASDIENVSQKTTRANQQIIDLKLQNIALESELLDTHRKITTLSQLVNEAKLKPINQVVTEKSNNQATSSVMADDHSLDDFYIAFEDKFRGSEKVILERLNIYLPYFEKLTINSKTRPVLDIGCGRGEFLGLMQSHKYHAMGLDLNEAMVKLSKDKGYDAVQENAITYMASRKEKSFSAITGFHIVEHIHFSELMQLFRESYRVLLNGGFVLFETPNPENLSVGAFSFYLDPSHLRPIPPEFLKFCLTYVGFRNVKIIPLHPALEVTYEDEVMDSTVKKLFGPQDYAVIGYK